MTSLLDIRDLATVFETEHGVVRAVDGVSLQLEAGGTLGVVGESGCGKSVMSLSIMGLVPSPPGRIEAGEILFEGQDLLKLDEPSYRALRGNSLSMIFQEPMTSLNPVYTAGDQIGEAIRLHQKVDRAEARKRTIELLKLVGIPAPEQRIDAYPHEMSGGMRQRVMIAMAISCQPKLLIADEPTTALDVTIQAQILDLLQRLQRELGMGIILITHDLGVVAQFVDHVLVMYAGRAVEYGPTAELFSDPRHPYTKGLLASVPGFTDLPPDDTGRRRLPTIEGVVPDMTRLPPGCRFRERCPIALARCATDDPTLMEVAGGRHVACFAAATDPTRTET